MQNLQGLTNEQRYRALLLEWFDLTAERFINCGYKESTLRDELLYFVRECRPADNESAAGDVLEAKLKWQRPKRQTLTEWLEDPLGEEELSETSKR